MTRGLSEEARERLRLGGLVINVQPPTSVRARVRVNVFCVLYVNVFFYVHEREY